MEARLTLLLSSFVLLVVACSPAPPAGPTAKPSPTLTAIPTAAPHTATPTVTATPTTTPTAAAAAQQVSPCQGLAGSLEIQILVGPSDAVGLEPQAVGTLPWQVTTETPPYRLSGNTSISYQDTLARDWGTFDVQMEMTMTADGTCEEVGDGSLTMTITMEGQQLVTVTSEGFNAEYPWAGTQTRIVTFPIQDGAMASGEGWAFVLHLN